MRFSLFFTLGYHVFGLGLSVDWAEEDAGIELQLGPFNVWAAMDWGLTISFLGRTVYRSK